MTKNKEKTNDKGVTQYIIKIQGMEIPVIIRKRDIHAQKILMDNKPQYCRLVRKMIKGEYKYYVQLVFSKSDIIKVSNKTLGKGDVGIDIGTQTIAVCGNDKVMLRVIADNEKIDIFHKEIRKIQRYLDRSRRANNPLNYNPDGTIKKGKKSWIKSKRYIKKEKELIELHRKLSAVRVYLHHKLSNEIIAMGDTFKVEKMNFKALQKRTVKFKNGETKEIKDKEGNIKIKNKSKKRYGKSIANRAPSMLIGIIEYKARRLGCSLNEINIYKVKASKYNHSTDKYEDTGLSKRWKIIGDIETQRDLYSSFLIKNVIDNEIIDKERCEREFEDFIILHNNEIERLKKDNKKYPSSMGIK